MNKLDISVVVPLYNEAESLPELVAWIDRSYLSPAEPWRDESRDEMIRMTLRVEGKPDYTLVLPAGRPSAPSVYGV